MESENGRRLGQAAFCAAAHMSSETRNSHLRVAPFTLSFCPVRDPRRSAICDGSSAEQNRIDRNDQAAAGLIASARSTSAINARSSMLQGWKCGL